MADLKTTASFDDSKVDAGLARMNRKFNATGEKIEKSTSGVRKLSESLSSTVGVVGTLTAAFAGAAAIAFGIGKAIQFIVTEQDRALERARKFEQTLGRARDNAAGFALSGQISRGEIDEFGAQRLEAKNAAEEARNAILEEFIKLNARAVEGIETEAQAAERLAKVRALLQAAREQQARNAALDDPRARAFAARSDRAIPELEKEIELLIALRNQLRSVRAEEKERIEAIDAQRQAAAQAAAERERQLEAEKRKLQEVEEERERQERARAERERKREEREARSLKTEIEIDRQRALGNDAVADALERERDLRRTIREINEAGGLTDAEKRELVEKAKETAEAEARAARERAMAAQQEQKAAAEQPQRSTVSLAAGLGGGLLAAQTFGANRTDAAQAQLAEQKQLNRMVEDLRELARDLLGKRRVA